MMKHPWWTSLVTGRARRDVPHRRTRVSTPDEVLLLSLLSPREQQRYLETHEFVVTGSARGVYLIQRGVTGNVVRLPQWDRLCAHPEGGSVETVMIAQLLAIQTDEPAFLSVVNFV
jgi:hypothetical protein